MTKTFVDPWCAFAARQEWVRADPTAKCWPGGPTREEYFAGFVRRTGSFVEGIETLIDVGRFFVDVGSMTEVEPADLPKGSAQPGNRYWTATVPDAYKAFEAVLSAGEMTDEELAKCKLVRGPHGVEVIAHLDPHTTTCICVITDDDGMVTWYPGRWMGALPRGDVFPVKAVRA